LTFVLSRISLSGRRVFWPIRNVSLAVIERSGPARRDPYRTHPKKAALFASR
jgi:hypothetical protein